MDSHFSSISALIFTDLATASIESTDFPAGGGMLIGLIVGVMIGLIVVVILIVIF
jgi:Mg/Co/Ni transporter MgtE